MKAGAIAVVVMAENEVASVCGPFATIIEAEAFADGVSEGGSHYGAGSCFGVVLPTEDAEDKEAVAAYERWASEGGGQ